MAAFIYTDASKAPVSIFLWHVCSRLCKIKGTQDFWKYLEVLHVTLFSVCISGGTWILDYLRSNLSQQHLDSINSGYRCKIPQHMHDCRCCDKANFQATALGSCSRSELSNRCPPLFSTQVAISQAKLYISDMLERPCPRLFRTGHSRWRIHHSSTLNPTPKPYPLLVKGDLLVLSGAARTGIDPHPGLEVPAATSAAAATAVVEAAPAAATIPATPATAKSTATCR